MPRFTIILPCCNVANTLRDTLDSLMAQTMDDWECFLIDVGSTDATTLIIDEAAARDHRFRVKTSPGAGASEARNIALTETTAPLLAFCEAWDQWRDDKLALMQEMFADVSVEAAFGRVVTFDRASHRSVSARYRGELTIADVLGQNPVGTLSNMVVRREAFVASGGFDRTLTCNEDLEWMIRMVGEGQRIVACPEPLVLHRCRLPHLSSELWELRHGREAALCTAVIYGHHPDPKAEALYLRKLAREALCVDGPICASLRLVGAGLATSPLGFWSQPHRAALTCAAVLGSICLPRRLRRSLFNC